jgi:hypothetical protein
MAEQKVTTAASAPTATTTSTASVALPLPGTPKKPAMKMTPGDATEWLVQRESLTLRMKHMEEKLERRKAHQKGIEGDVRKLQALLDGERENNAEIVSYYKKQVCQKLTEGELIFASAALTLHILIPPACRENKGVACVGGQTIRAGGRS